MQLAAVFAAKTPESIEAAKLLYLGVAFAVTWVVLAGYLFWIFRRQRRIEASLEKIRAQDNSEHPKLAADNKSPG